MNHPTHQLRLIILLTLFLPGISFALAQQTAIPRVEQMPNLPHPYLMRDWKKVTSDYDNLVFDVDRTGEYLPLVWINTNTINYPNHNSFGLHTVVGTPYPGNAEAINVLPAVISATLIGIDKSNQNGHNWVLGCEEWFNRRPEENVYLNGPMAQSGDDWWYAMMPNVFFYQLYDLYPGTGDFEYQFTSVANQWLKAVEVMGGSATPWNRASMNYRGWYLSTMTPYTDGVTEPESAGSIAWLLYNAYVETGESRYRMGAEWAMEFLSGFSTNAAYELQLPYGVYIAARMNAELGTTYNVDKMLNWCFDPDGNARQWGVTLGNWGGYDCYGLVGEALYDGYAFAMNGFEMAGALVPMVRYDDRYARAIGKWVLNMANASRLFYANYLPAENQDGEAWAYEYDTTACIAHESMREFAIGSGVSPFATGDAISGGWGETNFALYGSSHVGILGGIIDTTEVQGLLQLDLCKTDYFQDMSYPSYLYYNPYDEDKTVTLNAGSTVVDLYDAVSNQILMNGISGETLITIPADGALLAVLIPAGGIITYDEERMLVDGIVADYHSGLPVSNHHPRIKALTSDSTTVLFDQTIKIYCTAADLDLDQLRYLWTTDGDTLDSETNVLNWTAPAVDSVITIYCSVSDGVAEPVRDSLEITVIEAINHPPFIESLMASAGKIDKGDTTYIHCTVTDPDLDSLMYEWWSEYGLILGADSTVAWVAPDSSGYYFIHCTVYDGRGGTDQDSIGIMVRDSSGTQTGDPVAWYPFSGNAEDYSGLNNHGTVNGAVPAANRFGNVNCAYSFNGTSHNIRVPNSTSLNFTDAISVSFWMNASELYSSRESYPISHGNWENRWKVSIIPDKKIRWTIKTNSGVKDLDSQVRVSTNNWYHVVGLYDGTNIELYINGNLDARSSFTGTLLTTSIDLMIGQVLPNVTEYNFKGVLDDIAIYDYALSLEEITELYSAISRNRDNSGELPVSFHLSQNYPNPFNPTTTIHYDIPRAGHVKLQIFDISGRLVETLVDEHKSAGSYSRIWNSQTVSSGIYLYRMQADGFTAVKKCVKLK
jgi:hypothetical protein